MFTIGEQLSIVLAVCSLLQLDTFASAKPAGVLSDLHPEAINILCDHGTNRESVEISPIDTAG